MKRFTTRTITALALGLGLVLALLWVLGRTTLPAAHATDIKYQHLLLQNGSVLTVCPAVAGVCDYTTIQAAVDAAHDGDVIKVAAGTYTGVGGRLAPPGYRGPSVITQVVYISKTITIRGGYTTTNWTTPHPITQLTTLDAQGQGRVLYITGDISSTVEGLNITGGDAAGLGGSAMGGWDAGSGVCVITATVIISDNQVFSNTADVGGGLYLYNNVATLSSNTVSSNTASRGGGGLSVCNGDATLNGNTLSSNAADLSGGGLSLNFSRVTLNDNTISFNTNDGLILYSSYGSTLSGNTILSNTGSGMGLFYGGSTLCNNVVISNSGDGLTLHESASTLNDNIVSSNGGRGLSLRFSDATLNGNVVSFNSDGGLFLSESDATLNANTVTFNTADVGGGLYLDHSDATLTNNLIGDNQANTAGSGLYILSSSPRLLHTTLARNSGGDGSGIYVSDEWGGVSSVALTNTILVSQTLGITVSADHTVTLKATLWGAGDWANTTDWAGEGTIVTDTINVWGDPAFVDPDAGDYHVTLDSAAIDAGVDAGVTTDIDGDPRTDGHPDLGADELESSLAVTKRAYPDLAQPGAQLTYTIRVTNTGNVTLTATITDTLPDHITSGETSGGTLVLPGAPVTWTTVITAHGGVWMETVVVTVEMDYDGLLTNVVEVTTEEGATGQTSVTVGVICCEVYLPLVLRNSQ